ncbi:MAG: DUF58 domain-containing protein, partial [Deltaproteobacteria bacterium]
VGSIIAFSAVKNSDKVGLILFSDFVELYIPPKKGRSHTLRVIREILFFNPKNRRTDLTIPVDFINKILKRKSVAFLISDFCLGKAFEEQLEQLAPKLQSCNRRHDLISLIITDPREWELPDIGWITLEDAETSEQIELNTSNPAVRRNYGELAAGRQRMLEKTFRSSGIDFLHLSTDGLYMQPLVGFFAARRRRASL